MRIFTWWIVPLMAATGSDDFYMICKDESIAPAEIHHRRCKILSRLLELGADKDLANVFGYTACGFFQRRMAAEGLEDAQMETLLRPTQSTDSEDSDDEEMWDSDEVGDEDFIDEE